jgi:precorrin-3B synthase
MPIPARVRADACPGVFATHDAADGPLARVRLPGGTVSAAQLRALADCAEACGDGDVHLTSRGNVQLRGVTRPGLATRLADAGLLPSPSHERVRNVLASPLAELHGGLVDVRGLASALDTELCARPELAELPGRFLFAFDDGRGDVAGEHPDLCWRAVTPSTGTLLLAGTDTGIHVLVPDAVDALLQVATAFGRIRGSAWRVGEIDDVTPLLAGVPGVPNEPGFRPTLPDRRVGRLGPDFVVAPRFGLLSAAQLRVLADVAEEAVVTPWRTVVLPGAASALAELDAAGLTPDPALLGITACIGRPGCAKSRADVRADAVFAPGLCAHFSGCERRCGKPAGDHVDVVADDGGYLVDGRWVPLDRLKDSLVQKGTK